MVYLLLIELVRAYLLYDMNKQASQGDPAAKYSADKRQWRYYLAGVCLNIEADKSALS